MADEATLDGAPKSGRKPTRRELMAGAAGALGVLAAETVVRATPALANTGDPVLAGKTVTASTFTEIDSGQSGLYVRSGSGGTYTAIAGFGGTGPTNGVLGTSDTGPGISGYSTSGEGVYSQAGPTAGTNPGGAKNGVHGVTDSPTDSGVWGENVGAGYGVVGSTTSASGGPPACLGQNGGAGPGVMGLSASGDGVLGTTAGNGNAVHGLNTNTGGSLGIAVFGEHTGGGTGVFGQANSIGRAGVNGTNLGSGPGVSGTGGVGVEGTTQAGTGAGVVGATNSAQGTGVVAAANVSGGIALGVQGPATFSVSGSVSIPAGSSSATITGVSLRTGSLVLATVQNNAGVWVQSAVPNVRGAKVAINLNKAVPATKTATVAWFVVN